MISAERVPLIVALAFCAGLFTIAGALVGVAVAYAKRDEVAGTWGESILTYFITTFWVALAVGLIGWLLTLIWIGWIVLGLLYIWYAIRCLRATLATFDRKPIQDPHSLLI